MTDIDANVVAAIAALADAAAQATIIPVDTTSLDDSGLPASIPILWDRKMQRVVPLAEALNQYRQFPRRRRGTARAGNLDSFIGLINRQKTEESAIFGDLDWESPSLTAVINYNPRRLDENGDAVEHEQDADWGDHRIKYEFPLSEEWKTWIGKNNTVMSQADFAAFMEDNIPHLTDPTPDERTFLEETLMVKVASPSTILSLSRGLQVNVNAVVKENKVLQSGEGEVTFTEEHRDAAGGKIVVPGAFMLSIPLFYMGDIARIPVRLRYRVVAGSIRWFYNIYRPEVVIGERLKEDADVVRESTSLPVYEGEPEAQGANG